MSDFQNWMISCYVNVDFDPLRDSRGLINIGCTWNPRNAYVYASAEQIKLSTDFKKTMKKYGINFHIR